MIDDFHEEILKFIVRTHIETQRNLKMLTPEIMLTVVDDAMTMLSDTRDYFMWMVIRATESTAPNIMDLLVRCGEYCEKLQDDYHCGFFMGLSEVVQLKFQLDFGVPGDDQIDYDTFMYSWKKTCSDLGLEMREP
jgi:hypothetical protein